MSSSNFQEIDVWDEENFIKRFIPHDSLLVMTEMSNLILIIESKKRKSRNILEISFLDRIASILKNGKKGRFSMFGRSMSFSKDDAQKLANVLVEQSKKLKAMAETYNLMAVALVASKDNFEEIMTSTNVIKENPFE